MGIRALSAPPSQDALKATLRVKREHRLPIAADRQPLGRSVACDELGRRRALWKHRNGHECRDQRNCCAEEQALTCRIRLSAVTASDPDVERFLLVLAARRSPRTVDAYKRDLSALAAFREGDVGDSSVEELERWVASMRADGLASSTVAGCLRFVRTSVTSSLSASRPRTPLPRFSYHVVPARYPVLSRPPRPSAS